ncbi:cupin domain-containing protein [Pararhodobacter marinus]|jgi:quercetin dioxygenase-like cupin family protein|uniref:cupin domain-containing protein n=1 Tax=Pararhodobacter marinus TaxID=2184063 RepID=UPI00351826CF
MALEHAKPGEVVALRPPGERQAPGRTRAIVRTDSFEVVQLVVAVGTEIPTHKVPGRIMLQCLEGRVQLGLPSSNLELRAGDWLYLERGEPHSVRAIEHASLLLTILFDG